MQNKSNTAEKANSIRAGYTVMRRWFIVSAAILIASGTLSAQTTEKRFVDRLMLDIGGQVLVPSAQPAGLGGALTGYLFIIALRNGYDPTGLFRKPSRVSIGIKRQSDKKSKIISIFDTIKKHETELRENHPDHTAKRLDLILEKIKKNGRSSLSQDELDFLDKMSKS